MKQTYPYIYIYIDMLYVCVYVSVLDVYIRVLEVYIRGCMSMFLESLELEYGPGTFYVGSPSSFL